MRQAIATAIGFAGSLLLTIVAPTPSALGGAEIEKATVKADFYVAPGGRDADPGTLEKPFASLARAHAAVRTKVAAGLAADVLVSIRGGTYPQTETLTFGPEDSGTETHSVTYAAYPGEKVVFSGGRRITRWKKGNGEIWTADVPEVKAGKLCFRQLFVDGQRVIRARMPKCDDETPYWNIKSSTVKLAPDGLPIPPAADAPITLGVSGPIRAWKNISDVELVWIYNNVASRRRLASLDEAAQTLSFEPPYANLATPRDSFALGYQHCLPTPGKACYFENALELLSQPGEWYLDRSSGVLSYWPRKGEDLTRAEVVAPELQRTLLAVVGTRKRPVRNLHFKGIHVAHVDCPLPAGGHFGGWACQQLVYAREPDSVRSVWIDAAVRFQHARACSFTNGGVAHVGGMGLTMVDGTADITIEGNDIHDLGGGGIGAGAMRYRHEKTSLDPIPQEGEFKGYRIANNHVHHCGADYFCAVGIEADLTQETIVAHNLVHDITYCGMVFYGNMVHDAPFARDNVVECNHIYRVMKVATDGAGIYLILPQGGRGATIRSNLIHDIRHNPFNTRPEKVSFGVYLDLIAKNYHLENNVVYNVPNGPLFFCGANKEDNTWVDNIFQVEGTPPQEFIETMQAYAGLEPAYRRALLKSEAPACNYYALTQHDSAGDLWSGYQFDRPELEGGIVQVFRRAGCKTPSSRFKLRGLNVAAPYELTVSAGASSGPVRLLPSVDSVLIKGKLHMTGQELMEQGLLVRLDQAYDVAWISYRRK